jgi:hypothetical protein
MDSADSQVIRSSSGREQAMTEAYKYRITGRVLVGDKCERDYLPGISRSFLVSFRKYK